jgi:hypothetical protein
VPTPSNQLFQAWAARHRRLVDLEDRLKLAQEASSDDLDALTRELATWRGETSEALRQAMDAFHAEMRERGLE